jgi:hypothetical protein
MDKKPNWKHLVVVALSCSTIGCIVGIVVGALVTPLLTAVKPIAVTPVVVSCTPQLSASTAKAVPSPTQETLQLTVTHTPVRATATMPPLPKAVTATPVPLPSTTITITEVYATQLARNAASKSSPGELTIQNPTVNITSQYLEFTGRGVNLDLIGDGDIRIVGTPMVQDSKVHIEITQATINKFPLPSALFPQIEEMVDNALAQALINYDAKEITMEEGVLTLTVVPWQ